MTEAPRPPRPPGPRSIARTLALASLAFVGTLILLFGLSNVIRRGDGGAATTPPATAAPAATSIPSRAIATSGPSTSPAPGSDDPVLVGASDIADCTLDSGAATAALLDTIEGTVFTAGDNAYPDGSLAKFRECYDPTWGRHYVRTRPAAGNHEWETKDAAGYLGYFGTRAAPDGKTWYSYDLGTWHVVVLDSDCSSVGGCGPDSEQGRWLAADLRASSAQCTVAIWHQPRFSSGEHGNDPSVAPFWRALYDAGAELVINGHDHDYERFAPQDPAGNADPARGIREFVVGTGGRSHYGLLDVKDPNYEAGNATDFGVLRIRLAETSYSWEFVAVNGAVLDSGGPIACN